MAAKKSLSDRIEMFRSKGPRQMAINTKLGVGRRGVGEMSLGGGRKPRASAKRPGGGIARAAIKSGRMGY